MARRKPPQTTTLPVAAAADEPLEVEIVTSDPSLVLARFLPPVEDLENRMSAFLEARAFIRPLFFDIAHPVAILQVVQVRREVMIMGTWPYDRVLLCASVNSAQTRSLYQIPLTFALQSSLAHAESEDWIYVNYVGKAQTKRGNTVKEIHAEILSQEDIAGLGLPKRCWAGKYWTTPLV